ncbi:MAG: amino acid adenylation domain-containing protein, partial [Nitrosomonas sp.]|nr:amino acid adenylation domain-containing protein [Nitrosomonas sp.]
MKSEPISALDAELANRLASLSEKKRALLLGRLKQTETNRKNIIPKRSEAEEVIPLSFAQERLWFLSQLSPDGFSYNEAGAIELVGKLNIDAIEGGLREIVQRHEVLRTTFMAHANGQVQQIIASESHATIKRISLEALSSQQQSDHITQYISREVKKPFSLSAGPLIRFTLFQLDAERHILLVGLHHIIADEWSIRILIKELSVIYDACCDGRPSQLGELSLQYADYACWQREWLKGAAFEKQLGYWKKQLQGCPQLLDLPADLPRPAVLKHLGARYVFNMPSGLLVALRKIGKNQAATVFMTLAASFAILLNRYTQQHDICIGYPIANRSRSELQGLIGFFANTLVLRADLSGNPTFSELLDRVKKVCLEAQAYQDLPFEKLVEELAPVRDMSRHPLFQVMFIYQHTDLEKLELSNIEMNDIAVDTGNAKFDLTLSLKEEKGELHGCFEYSTELFYESTIVRWAGHYRQLLQNIIGAIDKPLSELVILPEEERRQVLYHWNDLRAEYPQDHCIFQFVEEQVKKKPNAIAVVYQDQKITYEQLNTSANQLAHYLHSQGIRPEARVGMCVERSLEMIIGILAILKAGGAYIPIDPRYPKEHIAHVIEDAMPQLVLTQEKLQGLIPAQIKRFLLDVEWDLILAQQPDALNGMTTPENLAYVIYTSGSTGKPKGVGVTHRNVVHSTSARLHYYQVPVDSFLLLSSIAFDSSVAGIFGTLCQGGRLVLAAEDSVLDPNILTNIISSQKISHLLTVPSLYEMMLLEIAGKEASLKSVIVAGESCKKSLIDRHYVCLPQVQLFNEYGPTEATVWSTVYQCRVNGDAAIPIGRPIANTCIYLLDAHLNPVPVGIAGELYIGGIGLARGYLNQPDLTALRFIPDYLGEVGGRLYRTGDLARYRVDGNIEYLGRTDHQVKIHGFRIELGQIEAVLMQHETVKEAVVMVREITPGEERLVAYLVENEQVSDRDSIRVYLKGILPDYMVPSAFVFLQCLPLTPNGKIDRTALPAPDYLVQHSHHYVAPRTPTEEKVTVIWAEVLRLEQVGVYDHFFELGGHSLLIAQVIARIRQVFAMDLPLRTLFERPIVADFALAIDNLHGKESELLVPLVSVTRDRALLPSYSQERLWFLDQFEGGGASYNVPGAVRLTGDLDKDVLRRSLNEIIRRHEVLRTTFVMEGGRAVQVIAAQLELAIGIMDLSGLPEELRAAEIQRHLIEDARKPFDLAHGPLVRASLLALGRSESAGMTEHILLFTLHHIVSDGWSTAILIREFVTLYEAYSKHQPSPLAELPIQYVDYAVWQRNWLQGERLEQQFSYWKQQLAGAAMVLELPSDRPRPVVQSYRGATLYTTIPQSITEQLKLLGRRHDATLFMVLLAAFNILLSRYSGQNDLCVGTPVANRNRLEIEGLIGLFINTLVLRNDLSGNPPFTTLLQRVREVCLGGQAHQDLPFEKLVEELAPVRDMSHHPLFQVMLVLQNTPETTLEIEGLCITPEFMETGAAKFDLDLEISEGKDGLAVQFNYNTDLFDQSTIARMAEHYGVLLEHIAAAPDRLLSELQLLTQPERNQLLVEWNATQVDYPYNQCIHELFEEQAKKRPDAVAVIFEGKQLTYGQLNKKANQLAHYLNAQGVGPEALVGICVERSLEMIVGILGILKAGGAYLPIDPGYPEERIAFMMEDARPVVVLIHEPTRGIVFDGLKSIDLVSEDNAIVQFSEEKPACLIDVQNLAYVIYTSGSTGKPKGSSLAHQGVVNRLVWMQQQ